MRAVDLPARLGGDEFAVILSEPIDADGISQAAETLRRQLARPLTLSDGQIVELAFSVGCARFGPDAVLADALSAADTALYADKRARKSVSSPAARDR